MTKVKHKLKYILTLAPFFVIFPYAEFYSLYNAIIDTVTGLTVLDELFVDRYFASNLERTKRFYKHESRE